MKTLLLIALMIPSLALARMPHDPPPSEVGGPSSSAVSASASGAEASAGAIAGSVAGAVAGSISSSNPVTTVTADPTATATGVVNSNPELTANPTATATASPVVQTSGYGGQVSLNQRYISKQEKQSPAIVTTGTNNNVPCHGEWHIGLSYIAGVSGGRDRRDKPCLLKLAGDELYDRGNFEAAARLYCKIDYYKDALGKDCESLMRLPPPEQPVADINLPDLSDYPTRAEVKQIVGESTDRAFRATLTK